MKILIGIDTSLHSRSTLASLCDLPCPEKSSVLALSVVANPEPQYAPEPQVVASVAGNLAVVEAAALTLHEQLVADVERVLREAGFDAKGRVAYGDPRHVLVDTARDEAIDLVVVGSHGHSGIGRRLLGSVASHVVAHAPCDVLVVKRQHPSSGR